MAACDSSRGKKGGRGGELHPRDAFYILYWREGILYYWTFGGGGENLELLSRKVFVSSEVVSRRRRGVGGRRETYIH